MKILCILLLCVFSLKSCGTAKPSKASKNIEQQEFTEKTIVFEYVASSRNAFSKIKISKNSISVSKKRGKSEASKPLKASDWEQLLTLSKSIPLETLSELEVPSKKFLFDGASKAILKITSNGKTYESAPFDHGNPPKEIEAFVKELLSISENIE
ncbi:hypothetical protein [Tamlana sp. I1]|uniref:hypothetical protein n=1 Tax=Tamlana sp. I1 TaxID=2762061 RepID=UPI00188E6D26|nr:hypothetical protein [Tamlana sp. I1]